MTSLPPLGDRDARDALLFILNRHLIGSSSLEMIREACGVETSDFRRPWDKGDMAGVEDTFRNAPSPLRDRMRPRLEWYRAIAALGFPDKAPARG